MGENGEVIAGRIFTSKENGYLPEYVFHKIACKCHDCNKICSIATLNKEPSIDELKKKLKQYSWRHFPNLGGWHCSSCKIKAEHIMKYRKE